MKKKSMIYLMVISTLIILSFDSWAQNNLELTINIEKDHYLLGEPVIVYTVLKNTGNEPVKVLKFLEPDFGFVHYFITRPDGEEVLFSSLMLKEHPSPEQTLPPTSAINAVAKIFFGSDGWTFNEDGQYLLRAVYLNKIASDTILININRPINDEEQRASEIILESGEVGFFMTLEGGDHLHDGVERLQEIVTELPKSLLSSYANYALGVNFANDFADFEKNKVRNADPNKAIKYLEMVKEKPIGLYYMANTYSLLADGYNKVGKIKEAKSTLQELNKIIDQSPTTLRPWVKEFIKVQKLPKLLEK